MEETLRERNKKFFWDMVGAYCRRCKYDECISALHLHHLDQDVKESKQDTLGYWLSMSRYNLVSKLANTRFTILCSNCHIKLHTVLRLRNVFLNPVDTTVFEEMLNCMIPPKKQIRAMTKKFNEDAANGIYNASGFIEEMEAVDNCREYRSKMGIDCEVSECGFCGIENIINKQKGN